MINAQTYLEHIKRDGERIADVAEGSLDKPVPSCPGNTIESLLMHTSSLFLFWTAALEQNAVPQPDWSSMDKDVLAGHRQGLSTFLQELGSRDPDTAAWSWGHDQLVRFWYRRAAQELSIHRWDFENAVATALSIDATLAADGVDEFLEEFSPKPDHPTIKGASQLFDGDGERLRFETTDIDKAWTLTARPEHFDISDDGEADVVARGPASDINLFVWGRVPPGSLDVSGDASLLDSWQERVKI